MSRPSLSVVVATRDRPQLLRRAVASILGQRYEGPIEVVAVFDQSEPDHALAQAGTDRSVRVIRNTRTPGLPGGRNSGIAESDRDLVAFCDDDDLWLPGKVAAQVDMLEANPAIEVVTTGVLVEYRDRVVPRVLERERITFSRADPLPGDGGPPFDVPRVALRGRGDRPGRRGDPRRLRRGLGLAAAGRSTGRRRCGHPSPREGLLARVVLLLGAVADDRGRDRLPAREAPGDERRPDRPGQRPRAQVDRPRRARPDR